MINIRILLAINNKEIKSRIDEKYKSRVYEYDIDCMENVIEFLSNKNEDFIVITKDTLDGNIDKKLYVKQLRLASKNSKIVYIVDNLTQEYKEFLFANEVFNIIEGRNINFDILINYIDNPRDIIYKDINSDNENECKNRIICICGAPGVGKSLVSSVIAKDISNIIKQNVLLLDMNIKNPSIDILNNLDSNNKGLYQFVMSLDNNIKNYIIKNDNISYLVNKPIKSLKISKSKLRDINHFLLNNYLYSFVDLYSDSTNENTKFWLDNATDIIVVVNPNYLSIRQTLNYLKEFKDKKVYIIVNAIKRGSLDMSQVKSLLSPYKIVGKIYYGKRVEDCINGAVSILNLNYDFYSLYKEFDLEDKVNIKNIYLETYKRFRENLERI